MKILDNRIDYNFIITYIIHTIIIHTEACSAIFLKGTSQRLSLLHCSFSLFFCLKLSIFSLCLTPSFSPLFISDTLTHTHTHTQIYIYLYTNTPSRLLCWVGWVVESLWGDLSALIGFWSTPLPFPSPCPSVLQHACHYPHTLFTLPVCVLEEAYSAFYLCLNVSGHGQHWVCVCVCVFLCDVCHRGSKCVKKRVCVLGCMCVCVVHVSAVMCVWENEWYDEVCLYISVCVCAPFTALKLVNIMRSSSSSSWLHLPCWPKQISKDMPSNDAHTHTHTHTHTQLGVGEMHHVSPAETHVKTDMILDTDLYIKLKSLSGGRRNLLEWILNSILQGFQTI